MEMKTKKKLVYIRQLIKYKRYNEARYQLVGIDHPTADRWLNKLNKIDDSYTATTKIPILFLLFSVVLVVGAVVVLVVGGGVAINTAVSIGVFLCMILLLFWSVWSRVMLQF